jgi:hypothetical protein
MRCWLFLGGQILARMKNLGAMRFSIPRSLFYAQSRRKLPSCLLKHSVSCRGSPPEHSSREVYCALVTAARLRNHHPPELPLASPPPNSATTGVLFRFIPFEGCSPGTALLARRVWIELPEKALGGLDECLREGGVCRSVNEGIETVRTSLHFCDPF